MKIPGPRSVDRRRSPRPVLHSISVPLPVVRTWRGQRVADFFQLPPAPEPTDVAGPPQSLPIPRTGQLMLITGASGSGKSTLLRQIIANEQSTGRRTIDLARLVLPDVPVVDCLPDLPLEAALALLGRMGLGEAWTYLRTPAELSDGQRWRLRLAVALHEFEREPDRPAVLVCDEFAALLDRVTAAIVSRSIRKVIAAHANLAAVVATSHDDVVQPLAPDRIVRCDFGVFTSLSGDDIE